MEQWVFVELRIQSKTTFELSAVCDRDREGLLHTAGGLAFEFARICAPAAACAIASIGVD